MLRVKIPVHNNSMFKKIITYLQRKLTGNIEQSE